MEAQWKSGRSQSREPYERAETITRMERRRRYATETKIRLVG